MVRKRSETFNETLPSIPEAPHDAEIQGTWSAALTTADRATPKISAAALFEEMAATLGYSELTPTPSFVNIRSSMTNLASSSKNLDELSEKLDLINFSEPKKENSEDFQIENNEDAKSYQRQKHLAVSRKQNTSASILANNVCIFT